MRRPEEAPAKGSVVLSRSESKAQRIREMELELRASTAIAGKLARDLTEYQTLYRAARSGIQSGERDLRAQLAGLRVQVNEAARVLQQFRGGKVVPGSGAWGGQSVEEWVPRAALGCASASEGVELMSAGGGRPLALPEMCRRVLDVERQVQQELRTWVLQNGIAT